MRTNLPVTDKEYVLLESDIIVSRTDLKGRITYVNPDFIRISGFSEEELIGSPHNLVRHPDMPEEAFDDLWRALKSGKAWRGLVKNRCKNGDYYWVEANAAPIIENHQVVGYASIRGRPSRDQIEQADAAYRAIKAGSRDLAIRDGMAVPRTGLGWLINLTRISIGARLTAMFGGFFVLFSSCAALGWQAGNGGAPRLAWWLSMIAAAGILLTLCSAFLLRREVSSFLHYALDEIRRMSSGDLTADIVAGTDDDTGRFLHSLRIMQINLKFLIGQIRDATHVVSDGASKIAAGNLNLSARTESQAASLQQTAASMEELTVTVKQNADSAQEARRLVALASTIAIEGGDAVRQVRGAMDSIEQSAGRIGDIIVVIDGIAFQTNMLALNAAVEAARAGEQGRGFAVVAGEVRTLAQRAAAAAREIKSLIDDSVEKVGNGAQLVAQAGATMQDIVASITRVTGIMGDIAEASQEQTSGIEQVNIAVLQMDQGTQQNAALVEEAAACAAAMSAQAGKLTELVAAFRLMSGSLGADTSGIEETRSKGLVGVARHAN